METRGNRSFDRNKEPKKASIISRAFIVAAIVVTQFISGSKAQTVISQIGTLPIPTTVSNGIIRQWSPNYIVTGHIYDDTNSIINLIHHSGNTIELRLGSIQIYDFQIHANELIFCGKTNAMPLSGVPAGGVVGHINLANALTGNI